MLELGIDFGSYTPNVTSSRIRCVQERYGGEWATIGIAGNAHLPTQMRECIAAGINVDTYLIPFDWWGDARAHVNRQLDRVSIWRDKISRLVWFDVESLPGQNPPPSIAVPYTRTAVETIRARGYEPGIYTSATMWASLMGGTYQFAEFPLWEALYGSYATYRPYRVGGWHQRVGVQWQGSTTLCELNVDLNTWETREQTMEDEQIKALVGEVLGLAVRNQQALDGERQLREKGDTFIGDVLVELAEEQPTRASEKLRKVYALAGKSYPYP